MCCALMSLCSSAGRSKTARGAQLPLKSVLTVVLALTPEVLEHIYPQDELIRTSPQRRGICPWMRAPPRPLKTHSLSILVSGEQNFHMFTFNNLALVQTVGGGSPPAAAAPS